MEPEVKEQVLYLLGAGFSAPLGLPVMSNFLFKSRDQYFAEPETYAYFSGVFELIRNLSDVKNYFKADLFNIEEILSVLEMKRHLVGGETEAHDYIKYLCDVVQYYTPTFEIANESAVNWYDHWLGNNVTTTFGNFVACLFNLGMKVDKNSKKGWKDFKREQEPKAIYAVVTLNYDNVLEQLCEQIRRFMRVGVEFCMDKDVEPDWTRAPFLAKLHGTVESENVIPPTWNKGLHPEIAEVWKLAYNLISTATQIRVVGYSLPETDSYVKYLLKSAVTEAKNLKQIDVICLDQNGTVKSRFDEFIDFPNYRFASIDVTSYLGHKVSPFQAGRAVKFDFIETLHGKVPW